MELAFKGVKNVSILIDSEVCCEYQMMDLEENSLRSLANHGLTYGATLWLDPEGPSAVVLT